MSNSKTFDYDVAFSFTQQDEPLALAINDLIQDRFRTFIYSEHQKILAGTDGEKTFNSVFGDKSRLVVILHRKDWANTPFTRIEETAIRNRGFNEGYDFTTFVQLDKTVGMPPWLPKNRIYFNFERWGAPGLASVIEARVKEAGGEGHGESIADRAERLKRLRTAQKERENFLRSAEATAVARTEISSIVTQFRELKKVIEDPSTYLQLGTQENQNVPFFELGYEGFRLRFARLELNSPMEPATAAGLLVITLYEASGHFPVNRVEVKLNEQVLKYDRDPLGRNGWTDYHTAQGFETTGQLLDKWVKKFIDGIENRRK